MERTGHILELPLLDGEKYTRGTPEQKVEFANALLECLKKHGFAKIINHGLDDAWVSELYEWV